MHIFVTFILFICLFLLPRWVAVHICCQYRSLVVGWMWASSSDLDSGWLKKEFRKHLGFKYMQINVEWKIPSNNTRGLKLTLKPPSNKNLSSSSYQTLHLALCEMDNLNYNYIINAGKKLVRVHTWVPVLLYVTRICIQRSFPLSPDRRQCIALLVDQMMLISLHDTYDDNKVYIIPGGSGINGCSITQNEFQQPTIRCHLEGQNATFFIFFVVVYRKRLLWFYCHSIPLLTW